MTPSDERLQEGIAAFKRGQKQEAGRFIKQAIELNPKNERAWLWLSAVVESAEQRRACLNRVLAINPQNGMAIKGLAKLAAESKDVLRPSASPIQPARQEISSAIRPSPQLFPPQTFSAKQEDAEPDSITALREQTESATKQNWLKRPLFFGLLLILTTFVVVAASLNLTDVSLASFNNPASSAELNLTPEETSAVVDVVYENIAAANSENIDRYMATIHSQSSFYETTRQELETLYQDYDLTAVINGVQIIRYTTAEARVHFVLETRKRSGPDFRDNRITGYFILRPENGQWRLYDQVVDKIVYYEYTD